jgi:hypothetical protein
LDRDSLFHPTEPEADPLIVYAVLEHAARESPVLRTVVPHPPPGTRRCATCGGDGDYDTAVAGETRTVLCQTCDGFGWIIDSGRSAGASSLP